MIRQRLEINNTATSSYAQREAKDSRIIPLNLCRKISSVSIPNSSWTKVTFFFFCSAIRRCKLSLENPDEVEGENVGTRNLKNIWSERRESFDRSTSRVNVPKRNAQQLNVRYWTRGLETSVDLFQKYRHCVFANEPPPAEQWADFVSYCELNFGKTHFIVSSIVEISTPRTEARDTRAVLTIDFITNESARDRHPSFQLFTRYTFKTFILIDEVWSDEVRAKTKSHNAQKARDREIVIDEGIDSLDSRCRSSWSSDISVTFKF